MIAGRDASDTNPAMLHTLSLLYIFIWRIYLHNKPVIFIAQAFFTT